MQEVVTDEVSCGDDPVGDKLTKMIKTSQDMFQVFDNVFLQKWSFMSYFNISFIMWVNINTTCVDTGKEGPSWRKAAVDTHKQGDETNHKSRRQLQQHSEAFMHLCTPRCKQNFIPI